MSSFAIAYFITPHGYGHAARAAAVMAALQQRDPAVRFEIFTTVSRQFFTDSPGGGFGYHPVLTDIGLVQENSLTEDIEATVQRLNDFLPFDPTQVEALVKIVVERRCRLIVCDIAPLGLAVAQAAGLPSLLIENFTWDWIYEGYLADEPRLERHLAYLRSIFELATYHIQTEPVGQPQPADLTVPPVSRPPRTPAPQMRQQLEIPDPAKVVMITMGGAEWDYTFTGQLEQQQDIFFIIAGNGNRLERRSNLIAIPRHSEFFHPDLVNASDALVGKVGYSTLAEVYQAGVPFGYIARPKFRESAVLASYIEAHLPGLPIGNDEFQSGRWLLRLPDLLALPRRPGRTINGAEAIADFVYGIVTYKG